MDGVTWLESREITFGRNAFLGFHFEYDHLFSQKKLNTHPKSRQRRETTRFFLDELFRFSNPPKKMSKSPRYQAPVAALPSLAPLEDAELRGPSWIWQKLSSVAVRKAIFKTGKVCFYCSKSVVKLSWFLDQTGGLVLEILKRSSPLGIAPGTVAHGLCQNKI